MTSENPVAAFHGHLRTLTPRAWVTPLLIFLNVAVFVAMTVVDKQPWSPGTAVLLRWGGNLGARTTGGQWWRLFTCMFLHGGVVHLAANMIVLWTTGPLVERMLGNLG